MGLPVHKLVKVSFLVFSSLLLERLGKLKFGILSLISDILSFIFLSLPNIFIYLLIQPIILDRPLTINHIILKGRNINEPPKTPPNFLSLEDFDFFKDLIFFKLFLFSISFSKILTLYQVIISLGSIN